MKIKLLIVALILIATSLTVQAQQKVCYQYSFIESSDSVNLIMKIIVFDRLLTQEEISEYKEQHYGSLVATKPTFSAFLYSDTIRCVAKLNEK